jgi:NitT/TauT family transport system permease protein
MFAALFLISLSGIAIFMITSAISYFALRRWHESAVRREN